jgi:hypothetical protein
MTSKQAPGEVHQIARPGGFDDGNVAKLADLWSFLFFSFLFFFFWGGGRTRYI